MNKLSSFERNIKSYDNLPSVIGDVAHIKNQSGQPVFRFTEM